jgi:hypothetical protein
MVMYLRGDLPLQEMKGVVGELDDPVNNGQFQTELKELTFGKYLEIITRVIRFLTTPTRTAF